LDIEARRGATGHPARRRAWTLAALATPIGLALYFTWRATSLGGLPDVGDPFDVAAFADAKIRDDDNAFVLYRQAGERLRREPGWDGSLDWADWATANESRRGWLAANREPLAIWRRGTGRPDARYVSPRDMTFATMLTAIEELRLLVRLATLEGTRREAEGDFSGALDYYTGILRSGKHCGRRGVSIERLVGTLISKIGCERITRWATDPRVDAAMLRRALDAVAAAEALTPTPSEVLKGEYMCFLNSLPDPKLLAPELTGGPELPRIYSWPGGRAFSEDLTRNLRREPERSRRVVRLVFANWLAACDLPPDRRPPRAAAKVPGSPVSETLLPDLSVLDASAPASARALPPDELNRWWKSTLYARRFLGSSYNRLSDVLQAFDRDRSLHANLMIALGNELYQRDHGAYPVTAGELVGPYLKALPEGYVAPE